MKDADSCAKVTHHEQKNKQFFIFGFPFTNICLLLPQITENMADNIINKFISVAYELYVSQDGKETIVESCTAERPFQFVSGLGFTFETFENNLQNLAAGDKFDFVIPKEDANGERDEEYVFDVDKSIFVVDGKFQDEEVFPGNIIPLLDADGNRIQAMVVEVKKDKVTIDLNHPFAGKDLHFKGSVLELRDATPDEVKGMLKIITGEGCGGCHGNCGECGKECGGCGNCED